MYIISQFTSYIGSFFISTSSTSISLIKREVPTGDSDAANISVSSERMDAYLARISELEERIKTLELAAHASPKEEKSNLTPQVLRMFTLLPLGKHLITPNHLSEFMLEAGILHPLMDIGQGLSVLSIFAMQCIYSIKQLKKEDAKESAFYIKMFIASATIILAKCGELLQGEFSSQVALLLHLFIAITAYYVDAPLEEYIENSFNFFHKLSHMKTE